MGLMHRIISCCANNDYSLWLHFEDGVKGIVNLHDLVGVGIFSAWRDIEVFKKISIDPIKESVSWEGGIDLDSDVLHEYLVSKAQEAMLH
jgi:hypothetical protein